MNSKKKKECPKIGKDWRIFEPIYSSEVVVKLNSD